MKIRNLMIGGCSLLFMVMAACAQRSVVVPPVIPHISEESHSIENARRLPPVAQPPVLKKVLLDLQTGTIDERIEKLTKKALDDLVFVEGGSYMMGDFGALVTKSHLSFTPWVDNKPAHKVTVSSFSISRYKTTFAEYDIFLDATHQPHVDDPVMPYRNALVPAAAFWQQAKDYCAWLGRITGEPFDLPTEAQWEYAARSRGQNFVFATDDGNLNYGVNSDDYFQLKIIRLISDNLNQWGKGELTRNYPVGIFPANPIGLFDMNSNGYEWMNDWYSEDYYSRSPEIDPQGPSAGRWKVLRNASNGEMKGRFNNNLTRSAKDPNLAINSYNGKPYVNFFTKKPTTTYIGSYTLRCVVNSRSPISHDRKSRSN